MARVYRSPSPHGPGPSYIQRMNDRSSPQLPPSRTGSFPKSGENMEGSITQAPDHPLFRKSPARNIPSRGSMPRPTSSEQNRMQSGIPRTNSLPMASESPHPIGRSRSMTPSMRSKEGTPTMRTRDRSQTPMGRGRSNSRTPSMRSGVMSQVPSQSRLQTPVRKGSNLRQKAPSDSHIRPDSSQSRGRIEFERMNVTNIRSSSPMRHGNESESSAIPSYISSLGLKNNHAMKKVNSLPSKSSSGTNVGASPLQELPAKSYIASMQQKGEHSTPLRPKHHNGVQNARTTTPIGSIEKNSKNVGKSKVKSIVSDILDDKKAETFPNEVSKENSNSDALSTNAALGDDDNRVNYEDTPRSRATKKTKNLNSEGDETRFWTQISIQVSTGILQAGGSEKEAEIGQMAVLTTGHKLADTSTESVNYAASKVSMALMENGADSHIIAAATMGCLKQFDTKPRRMSFMQMAKESLYESSEILRQSVKSGVENGSKYFGNFSERATKKYEEVAQMLEESRQYEEEMHRTPRRSRSAYRPKLRDPVDYDRRRTDDPKYYSRSSSRRRSRSPGRRGSRSRMRSKGRRRERSLSSSSGSSTYSSFS